MHNWCIYDTFVYILWKQGVSLSSVLLDGEEILVAFGGYNGKYNNEVSYARLHLLFYFIKFFL